MVNKKRRKKLKQLVRYWQRRLGMDHWKVGLCINEYAPEVLGSAQPTPGRPEAEVMISAESRPSDDEALVCHELVHLALDDFDTLARQWAARLPKSCRSVFLSQWDERNEQVVDRIQKALCAE